MNEKSVGCVWCMIPRAIPPLICIYTFPIYYIIYIHIYIYYTTYTNYTNILEIPKKVIKKFNQKTYIHLLNNYNKLNENKYYIPKHNNEEDKL